MSGTSPRHRRFTLLDVMILVAATAIALAVARAVFDAGSRPDKYLDWVFRGPFSSLPVAGAAAVLTMRCVRPRPRWRRIARQPGAVACAATLTSMPIGFACGFILQVMLRRSMGVSFAPPFDKLWLDSILRTPQFVVGAAVALWLSGARSAERSWIDRAGRTVGLFWIVACVETIVHPFLSL